MGMIKQATKKCPSCGGSGKNMRSENPMVRKPTGPAAPAAPKPGAATGNKCPMCGGKGNVAA